LISLGCWQWNRWNWPIWRRKDFS